VSEPNKGFQSELAEFLNDFPNGDIGLVLSERIVNMPDAVAPPSYKMLLEEIQWANEDVLRFSTFSNLLERALRL